MTRDIQLPCAPPQIGDLDQYLASLPSLGRPLNSIRNDERGAMLDADLRVRRRAASRRVVQPANLRQNSDRWRLRLRRWSLNPNSDPSATRYPTGRGA